MATLPKCIEILAPLTGRGEPTVKQVGKTLRETGHIGRGKRGKGAPDLSPKEITSLVIGIMSPVGPNSSGEYVVAVKSMRKFEEHEDFRLIPKLNEAVKDGFFNALQCAIENVRTAGEFTEKVARNLGKSPDEAKILSKAMLLGIPTVVELNFRIIGAMSAEIVETEWTAIGREERIAHFVVDTDEIQRAASLLNNSDRLVSIKFGIKTLVFANSLVTGEYLGNDDQRFRSLER